jgi:hypothetical protein
MGRHDTANTVEPRSIVPVVFPHVSSALFGPEMSPISITLFFPASFVPQIVVFPHQSLKNHGPDATFSRIDSFFKIGSDGLVRCASVYCFLSVTWIGSIKKYGSAFCTLCSPSFSLD